MNTAISGYRNVVMKKTKIFLNTKNYNRNTAYLKGKKQK